MCRAPFRVPKLHRTRSTADIFTIDIQPRQCENQTVTYAFTLSSCGSVCVCVRLCVLACVCVFAYTGLIKASFVNTLGERYHLTRHSHLQQYPSARVYISGKSWFMRDKYVEDRPLDNKYRVSAFVDTACGAASCYPPLLTNVHDSQVWVNIPVCNTTRTHVYSTSLSGQDQSFRRSWTRVRTETEMDFYLPQWFMGKQIFSHLSLESATERHPRVLYIYVCVCEHGLVFAVLGTVCLYKYKMLMSSSADDLTDDANKLTNDKGIYQDVIYSDLVWLFHMVEIDLRF